MKALNKLGRLDQQYIWHPFTQMREWLGSEPLIIERGQGAYLYDTAGNKYLDGVSSLWTTIHGHQKKAIDQAIKDQLGKIAHSTLLGLGNIPSIKLAKELVSITPRGLAKVFYSDDGSTAVEIALKIAFQYQQQVGKKTKRKFLTLVNAYHGDTVGSVSVGGIDLYHKIYRPLLFKAFKAPSPYCYRCPDRPKCRQSSKAPCLVKLENIMKNHHREIAAMIIEPMVQAAAGMLTLPRGYMKTVQRLCRRYDILLICDEVATGFGRTGKMFACEHENITPDLMCLAKGITGGYLPVAATLTTKHIFNAFLGEYKEKKTFFHGHTYTGNPLGCAAALANLNIFKKEKTLKQLQPKIAQLNNDLQKFWQLKSVGDIRQVGFMAGIELVKDKLTGQPFPPEQRLGHQVCLAARKKGAILRPLGDIIVLMPPLGISQKELKDLVSITYQSIEEVTA